jgi:RNA polymerase sigma-70 factor (ECF subfamily)
LDSPLSTVSDEELARRTQAGSRQSFEELIARYGRRLFCYLKPKIASDQDAEDIVQETFLRLYRNIERYDSRWKFSTWLYTTAGRLAISHYRAHSHKRRLESAAQVALKTISPPHDDDLHSNIWDAARGLKPSQYEAIWLRYVEGLPLKEIADALGKSPLAVRLLLHRARLNLAGLVGISGEADKRATRAAAETPKTRFKEDPE